MSDEPDIEPETAKKIFLDNVLKIAPRHLTENAFRSVHTYTSIHACVCVYAQVWPANTVFCIIMYENCDLAVMLALTQHVL